MCTTGFPGFITSLPGVVYPWLASWLEVLASFSEITVYLSFKYGILKRYILLKKICT